MTFNPHPELLQGLSGWPISRSPIATSWNLSLMNYVVIECLESWKTSAARQKAYPASCRAQDEFLKSVRFAFDSA
jgi:hypothetical protein